jgi:hypothetical protein
MANVARHSSRLMGFHLRDYKRGDGDETEMFSARIFLHESEVGFARNGGDGGPDLIQIHPEHRDAWDRLVAYMDENPVAVREDGSRDEYLPSEEAARLVLRDLHDAERSLSRSRKHNSGLLGFTWEHLREGGGWWAIAVTLFTPATDVDPEAADPDLFRILVLGTDNPRFLRVEAPLPRR